MSFKRFALPSLIATAAFLSMGAAHAAGTATGTFNVNINVIGKCVISTAATDIDFGTVEVGAATVTKNNTFSVQCSKKTGYTITLTPLNAGTGDNGGKMKTATGETIDYTMFSDAAGSAPWGKTVGVSGTSSSSSSAAVDYKVYAKVTGGVVPDVPVGTYTDKVTITVTY